MCKRELYEKSTERSDYQLGLPQNTLHCIEYHHSHGINVIQLARPDNDENMLQF